MRRSILILIGRKDRWGDGELYHLVVILVPYGSFDLLPDARLPRLERAGVRLSPGLGGGRNRYRAIVLSCYRNRSRRCRRYAREGTYGCRMGMGVERSQGKDKNK